MVVGFSFLGVFHFFSGEACERIFLGVRKIFGKFLGGMKIFWKIVLGGMNFIMIFFFLGWVQNIFLFFLLKSFFLWFA